VVTSFSFPFSPNYRIIDAFPPTSFYLPVLSTAILNWGKAFVNKKLQKNSWLPKLNPLAVSGSCHHDARAPPQKKSGRRTMGGQAITRLAQPPGVAIHSLLRKIFSGPENGFPKHLESVGRVSRAILGA
jgi:hypothetical protein